jgi:hypothetical protein
VIDAALEQKVTAAVRARQELIRELVAAEVKRCRRRVHQGRDALPVGGQGIETFSTVLPARQVRAAAAVPER